VNKNKGMIWPYAIGTSIVLVFGAAMATVAISIKSPVELSNTYMMGYHEANDRADEIIKSRISFDKKYKIEYLTEKLSLENTVLKYRITDVNNKPVDNAKMKVVITRPNNHKYDQELENPKVENGVYSFENITLAVAGRWDIMAKLNIDENQRFYNLKADTRAKEAFEY